MIQINLIFSTSLESYLCDEFSMSTKVREGLDSVPKWKEVLGAEGPGERAQLCMQDMELPHPAASPAPAVVCDYAPGPSAQGL